MTEAFRIVSTSIQPDLDGVACAIAYAYLLEAQGIKALPSKGNVLDGEALFHLDRLDNQQWATAEQVEGASEFVLVDFSWLKKLPTHIDRMKVVEVIDHHPFNQPDSDYPNSKNQVEHIGAAATQIVERFIAADIDMPFYIAELLYGAIYSNTQSLKGAVTIQRDHDAAHHLEETYGVTLDIVRAQYKARTEQLLANVNDAVTQEFIPASHYGVSQLEMLDASRIWETYKEELKSAVKAVFEPSILSIVDALEGNSIHYVTNGALGRELAGHFPHLKQLEPDVYSADSAVLRKQIFKVM